MKFTKQIDTFTAQSDNGELYKIIELQEYNSILTSSGAVVNTEGRIIRKTTTGLEVKIIDSETYRIVTTNQTIHKVSG